jgi:hypothetical protein
MSDIDEMIKMYKEVQENYIKALERENEELRKQKETDSLKIEELEKRLLEERANKYVKNIPLPTPFDDKTVIGPGNGWGYPQNPVIWTSNNAAAPATYTTNTTTFGGTASGTGDTVGSLKETYETMKAQYDMKLEASKVKKFRDMFEKMQKGVEDDN